MLDIIRGLAVLNMIAFHLLYDMVYIFGFKISWFSIRQSIVWERFICCTFILVAGISFSLSRKPWKNGLRLLLCAFLLTAVTGLTMPDQIIRFGILHFLGCAILLTWLGRRRLREIPAGVGFGLSLFLFILLYNLPAGRLSLPLVGTWPLPAGWYESPYLFWLGFPWAGFYSADYFPLLPWFFLFLTGYFGGGWWRRGSEWVRSRTGFPEHWSYRLSDVSLGAAGRKSLMIYMLHQPVLYGFLLLLQVLFKF